MVEDARTGAVTAAPGRPEALEHVANRPIAYHVLDSLESAGIEDVVVATSTEFANDVRRCLRSYEGQHELRLRFVARDAPVEFPDALGLAAPVVGSAPCIVHLASGLLGEPLQPLISRLRTSAPDLALIVHPCNGTNGHLSPATQEMLHLAELDPKRAALSMAGVSLFGPDALRRASTAAWRAGTDIDLTTVAERIRSAGGSFDVLACNGWRWYGGNPLDLLELNRIALDRLDTEPDYMSNNGNRIEGRVLIDERASVRASVIVGPAVIGPDTHVSEAYIGPYTSIGAGARIEGAEIERSIISAGATIMHIGGRLTASVVGRNARVFRDFSLPRALRLRVGEGTEVALC